MSLQISVESNSKSEAVYKFAMGKKLEKNLFDRLLNPSPGPSL